MYECSIIRKLYENLLISVEVLTQYSYGSDTQIILQHNSKPIQSFAGKLNATLIKITVLIFIHDIVQL